MAIVVKIQGGLGNQLFQFAFGEALSHKLKQPLYLDLHSFINNNRKFGLTKFNIKFTEASTQNIDRYFTRSNRFINKHLSNSKLNKQLVHFEEKNNFYNIPICLKGNSYYLGYWQSENYFSDISLLLKEQFTLQTNLSKSKLLTIIKSVETVAVHVRRGDYLQPEILKVHGVIDLEYYRQAITIISGKISTEAVFIIFSDDEEWIKLNFELPCNWISANTSNQYSDEETLVVMSLCNHQIIANSTYSWWAAWLNNNPNKRVIAPKNWFVNNTSSCSIIPTTWIVI